MTVPKGGHIEVIEAIAKGLKAEGNNGAYLELGYAKGACFDKVMKHFKRSVAVDIDDKYKFFASGEYFIDQSKLSYLKYFFKGTSDNFFRIVDEKFNLIFIDADHHYESVKKDFINSFKVLKKNGLIILHDTWSESKAWTKYCFDAHKITEELKDWIDSNDFTSPGEFEFCTLPFHSGMTIVRKL